MNAVPQLSIGLPVYNGENYLAESLDALLGQSYENFELVISDNASSDGTAGKTPLHASYHFADRALFAEIPLNGPFYQVPDWLHFRREHASRGPPSGWPGSPRGALHQSAGEPASAAQSIISVDAVVAGREGRPS